MKKLFVLSMILAILSIGCVSSKIASCPDQRVYFKTVTGITIMLEKGYLNPDQEGETWLDQEAYDKIMEDVRKSRGY